MQFEKVAVPRSTRSIMKLAVTENMKPGLKPNLVCTNKQKLVLTKTLGAWQIL